MSIAAAKSHLVRIGALLVLLAVAAGCNQEKKAPEKKAPEVFITTPVQGEVVDYEDFTGRLDAIKTVDIRARVTGFLLQAPFIEGQLVHEGDLLFRIDPQSYDADLKLAKANHKLAEADERLQQANTARARLMLQNNSMSPQDYDTAAATLDKSRANSEAMAATRDRAKLYDDWTKVTAPLSGRISRRLVDPGNLVVADNTVLTTIVNDTKLWAYFDIDERTYLELARPLTSEMGGKPGSLNLPVLMSLANEDDFTRTGVVDFVDNRVVGTTGTIRLRAVFDNPNGELRAGLFARIRLPLGTVYTPFIIPDEAVASDQGRKYVYVVDDKNEIVYRPVTLGQEIKTLRVIKEGIAAGDRVVVNGMQRVRPGVQVTVKKQEPPRPPDSPLAQLLRKKLDLPNVKDDKVTR
jgi:RND family efflux transporter MFP subunit